MYEKRSRGPILPPWRHPEGPKVTPKPRSRTQRGPQGAPSAPEVAQVLRSIVNMQVICTPAGRAPVAQVLDLAPQPPPPPPKTSKTGFSKRRVTLERSSFSTPHAGPLRGRRIPWPAATCADPEQNPILKGVEVGALLFRISPNLPTRHAPFPHPSHFSRRIHALPFPQFGLVSLITFYTSRVSQF